MLKLYVEEMENTWPHRSLPWWVPPTHVPIKKRAKTRILNFVSTVHVALKENILLVENLESPYICMHKTLQNISDMSDINMQWQIMLVKLVKLLNQTIFFFFSHFINI